MSLAPIPQQSPLIDTGDPQHPAYLATDWYLWLFALVARLDATPATLKTIALTSQAASLATTGTVPAPSSAVYRITYYARITRAATTNSSLTVTIGWTDNTVSCTQAGAALTGNTTATTQSATVIVRGDQASALTYATTYASTGATAMQYSLSVIVEQLTP